MLKLILKLILPINRIFINKSKIYSYKPLKLQENQLVSKRINTQSNPMDFLRKNPFIHSKTETSKTTQSLSIKEHIIYSETKPVTDIT
jgi:hypothetical protein